MDLAPRTSPLPTTRPQATSTKQERLRTPVGLRRAPSRPDLIETLADTERVAAEVAGAAATDAFGAAAVAYRWLGKVRDVEPHMFEEEDARRAWAEAWCVLDGVARNSRRDAHLQEEVARYLACKGDADELDRELGPDPMATLDAARGRSLQAARLASWRVVLLIFAAAPTLFCLVAGPALGTEGLALTLLGTVLALPTMLAVHAYVRSIREVGAAEKNLERVSALVTSREAFSKSPLGGAYLSRIARQHPLVRVTVAPRSR